MSKSDLFLGIAVFVVGVLIVACASSFDASNVHHSFGFGSKTHIVNVPDSASVSTSD